MRSLRAAALAAVLSVAALPTMAGEVTASNAWARASMGAGHNGAIFLELSNQGSETRSLVAAETPVAARAELHKHMMNDGVMQMRQVPEVALPAGETVALQPGGLHVMLFGLKDALAEGANFEATLTLDNGDSLTVPVEVKAMGYMGEGHGMGQGMGQGGMQGQQPKN